MRYDLYINDDVHTASDDLGIVQMSQQRLLKEVSLMNEIAKLVPKIEVRIYDNLECETISSNLKEGKNQ